MHRFPKENAAGFSLIELLLVMGTIAILLGLGTMILPRPDPVQGAQIVSSLVERARIQAIATGRPSAVVILVDDQSEDRLRKIGIVQQSVTDAASKEAFSPSLSDTSNAGPSIWNFDSNPIFLPAGLAINENASSSDLIGTAAQRIRIPALGGTEGEGLEWFFYGFTSGGEPRQPGGRIVVGDPQRDNDFRIEITRSGRPSPPIANLTP